MNSDYISTHVWIVHQVCEWVSGYVSVLVGASVNPGGGIDSAH